MNMLQTHLLMVNADMADDLAPARSIINGILAAFGLWAILFLIGCVVSWWALA